MKNRCIGIGKELGKWERRAPLCPVHVQMLTQVLPHLISVLSLMEVSPSMQLQGIRVLVEPSHRRIFSDDEYRAAGAEVVSAPITLCAPKPLCAWARHKE